MAGARGHIPWGGVLIVAAVAVVLHISMAWRLRLHQGRSLMGSFEEVFLLASVVALAGAGVTFINMVAPVRLRSTNRADRRHVHRDDPVQLAPRAVADPHPRSPSQRVRGIGRR